MSTAIPLGTTAALNFFVPPKDGARAYQNAAPVPGVQERNFTIDVHDVQIQNLRGNESAATLDTTGFQIYKHAAKHASFTSDADLEKEYYAESIELIKRLTGASRVVLFDHSEDDDAPGRRQPVSQTHIDQTNASAVARVHRHLPAEEVPELLKPVDWPLALRDFRTVDPVNDILPIALVTTKANYSGGQNYSQDITVLALHVSGGVA
ncbi:hypothetical protein DFH09DRAFT_1280506 [Mycena vulgaris]|nr:hypothetical protein DFH09DRAFT_1280506 [Mycena vulgaris]